MLYVSVSGEMSSDGSTQFTTSISASIDYKRLVCVVRIDELVLARVDLPATANVPLQFEKRLDFTAVLDLSAYDVSVNVDGDDDVAPVSCVGAFFFVTHLSRQQEFYSRVQLAGTRVSNPFLQQLGAKAAFQTFKDYPARASALTVYGHRIIDRLKIEKPELQPEGLSWFIDAAKDVVLDGSHTLASEEVRWDSVRWTLSLATVLGNILICQDRLEEACNIFSLCYTHRHKVAQSRVSGLNIVNGCFFYGILSHILGHTEQAADALRACVSSYPDVVFAQDLFENVWVVGDLLNCTITVRQAYIALVKFGYIDVGGRVVVDHHSMLDLRVIQSPVGRLLVNGRAVAFARALGELGQTSV